MAQERISIVIEADDAGLQATLRRSGKLLQQFGATTSELDGKLKHTESSIHKFAQGFRGMVLDINLARHAVMGFKFAVLDWMNPIVKSGAMFERTGALMMGMSTATDQATRALESQANTAFLVQKAMANPFGIKALQDSMVKLKSIGFDPTAGALHQFNDDLDAMQKKGQYSTKGLAVNMQALLDSVANFGGSEDQLKRASVAIQQMAGKGVISMEELRQQLGEAVPNAVQLLADSLNMTYGDLVKKISEGKVKAKPALVMLFREMELAMGGSSARMMKTWDGMMSQFETSWELFKANIFKGGLGDALKTQLTALTNWLNSPEGIKSAKEIAEAIAGIVKWVAEAIKFVIRYKDEIVALATAFLGWKAAMAAINLAKFIAEMRALKAASMASVFAEMTAAMKGIPTFAGRAAASMGVLRAAMGGLVGIAGAAAASIGMLIYNWIKETEEIEKNTLAILNNKNARTGDEEAIKQQSKVIEDTKKGIASAQAMLDKAKANMTKAIAGEKGTFSSAAANWRYWSGIADEETKKVAVGQKNLAILQKNLEGEKFIAAKNTAEQRMRILNDEMDRAKDIATAQYKETMDALNAEREAVMKNGGDIAAITEKIEKEKQAATEKRMAVELDIIDKALAEEAKIMRSSADTQRVEEGRRLTALLNDRRQQIKDMMALNYRGSDILSAGSKNTGDGVDPLEARYKSLSQTLAKLKAETKAWGAGQADANEEVAKAIDLIEKQGIKGKVTEGMVKSIAKEVDKQEESHRLAKAAIDAYTDGLEGTKVQLSDLKNEMEDSKGWDSMSSRTRGILAILNEIKAGGPELDGVRKKLEDLFSTSQRVDLTQKAVDGYKKLTDKTEEWTEASLEGQAARDAAYKKDIEDIRELEAEAIKAQAYTAEAQAKTVAAITARNEKYLYDSRNALKKWADEWVDVSTEIEDALASAVDGMTEAMADFVVTGKGNWTDLRDHILKMIADIIIKQTIAGLVGNTLDMFGWGGGGATESATVTPHANGGIMTSQGSLPLRKYSNGGVAKSPQLALFGEGRTPEAYVPLPDGRTIPVTMKSDAKASAPEIHFNLVNQSGQAVEAQQTGAKFDGERMVLDVVLKNMQKGGKFRSGMKSGMNS